MFIDEVILNVIGGRGGDGVTSFRHEKFVEMGGPDGGNGGNGGNVIFVGNEGLKTLIDLRYQKKIKGEKGGNGSGALRTGATGKDVYVKVPVGTTIIDLDTNLIVGDITKHNEEVVVCKGGRGGKGNAAFKSNKNKAPQVSEKGLSGEERTIKLELKLLADVGLVGFPSVGKSSLISVISDAKPKIAEYHYTTLTPNLGVVKMNDNSFVVADLPGIIEGASKGVGLGDKFLKHASRSRVIAYVLDMSEYEGRDVLEEYETLLKEVKAYSEKLFNKRSIVIANKMDSVNSEDNLKKFKDKYPEVTVVATSAVTRYGIDELKNTLSKILSEVESADTYENNEFESYVLYEFKKEKPYTIKRIDDHTWVLSGDKLETLLMKTRFNSDEAVLRFARKIKGMGVDDELRSLGAKDGDIIRILDEEFEYNERLDY